MHQKALFTKEMIGSTFGYNLLPTELAEYVSQYDLTLN